MCSAKLSATRPLRVATLGLSLLLVSFPAHAQLTNAVPPGGGQSFHAAQDEPDGPSYVDGEILVKFRPGATDQEVADLVRRAAVNSAGHILTPAMRDRGDIGITRLTTALLPRQALQALQNHPAIEYAQPNWIYRRQLEPNDEYYLAGSLWGMGSGFGSQAAAAWAAGNVGLSGVCVGVIDEGIQFDHPDLAGNIWRNPAEISGVAGTDDDHNGYLDDIYGWNAISDSGAIFDPGYDTHGTHVAGTIGAKGGNSIGVVGVNWNVSIIAGKFLGRDGTGSTLDAVQAIDYMTHLKTQQGVNIVALNNSWGGGGSDPTLLASITAAAKANILIVAAAGNESRNTDRVASYPACYDTSKTAGYDAVISVTAIAKDGSKPSWANYGAKTVDLGAPGVGIWSTVSGGTYVSMDGTSMATPHVTGAIALYASKYPGAAAADIRAALLNSAKATPTASLSGKTVTGGRLDIDKFLAITPPNWVPPEDTIPSAPSGLTATVESVNQVRLTWLDVTGENFYKITRTEAGASAEFTVGADLTSYLDTGLKEATTYSYQIVACNSAGCSSATAASEPVTTGSFPPSATASYVASDDGTQGNWIGNFGGDGYNVIQYSQHYPSYATVSVSGQADWGWVDPAVNPTTDVRALQQEPPLTGRWLGCYYSSSSFALDLSLTDGKSHQVAFYVVDWDSYTRAENVEIFDYYRQTKVGNTVGVASFHGGRYLIYEISGRVLIRFTHTGGKDAVLSGIFFGGEPPPDFSVAVAPSSATVTAGGSAAYSLTVTPTGGYQGTVTWNVSGLPANATAAFSPASGSSTMTVTTSSSTPKGTYGLTITGSDGTITRTVNATLVVNPVPAGDFLLSVSPLEATVKRGGNNSVTYTVQVTPSVGFAGTVSFMAARLPIGASASFDPVSVDGSGTSRLTVKAGGATALGTYTLEITGTCASPSLSHTIEAVLTVTK